MFLHCYNLLALVQVQCLCVKVYLTFLTEDLYRSEGALLFMTHSTLFLGQKTNACTEAEFPLPSFHITFERTERCAEKELQLQMKS